MHSDSERTYVPGGGAVSTLVWHFGEVAVALGVGLVTCGGVGAAWAIPRDNGTNSSGDPEAVQPFSGPANSAAEQAHSPTKQSSYRAGTPRPLGGGSTPEASTPETGAPADPKLPRQATTRILPSRSPATTKEDPTSADSQPSPLTPSVPTKSVASSAIAVASRRELGITGSDDASAVASSYFAGGSAASSAGGGTTTGGFGSMLGNSTPTLHPAQGAQGVDGQVTGALHGVDTDGDKLKYTVTTQPAHGTVTVEPDGSYTYTPDQTLARMGTTDSFSVVASDADSGFHIHGIQGLLNLLTFGLIGSSGHTRSATVDVTVAPWVTNRVPIGSANLNPIDNLTGAVTGSLSGVDPDGDVLTYSGPSTTAKGTLTFNDTNLVSAPVATPTGSPTVSSGSGAFTYMPSDAARHAASSLTATAADKTDTFNLTVSDGFGGTVTIPITVAISPLNTAPVAGTATIGAADPVTGRVTGRVNAGDGNGDTLVYSGTSTTPKGAVTINSDGTFTYTPTAAARHNASSDTATPADKTDTFTATATDGHGGTTSLPVTVTISPANSLPSTGNAVVLSLNSATGVVVVKFAGTDADGDNLTFSGSTTTSKGSVVVSADGTLTYSPTDAARHAATASTATAADRNDSFTITVNDGHGGRVDVPLNIAVTASNAAPVATPTVGTPDSSGVVRGTLAATDSDGDAVVYNTGTTATARGSVTLNSDGTFTYTPTNTARHNAASDTASVADKTDSFTATVGDGHGGTTRVTVSVPITSANTPLITGTPTVGSPDGTTGVVTGRLPATDADGDTLDYSGPITTAKGQIVVNSDGTFTYTPTSTARHALSAPDASAEQHMDSFTINVTDGHGSTASVPITVMLTASNAAPVAGTAVMSIPDRSTGLITGTFTDTDADGDELTYTGTGPTSKGVVVVYHDGTFTYTPSTFARQAAFAENATAAQKLDSFTVKVSDGHGGSAEYTVEVPLGFVNAPPTAGTTTVSSPDGVTGGVSGTVTATDLDNDQVTFSGSATTAHGSVIVHPNGTFTYTPTTIARHAASATAASAGDLVDTFTVTATDSRGGTTPIPVTVSIASLNTAPVVGTPTVGRPDSSGSVIGTVLASDPDGDVLSYSVPAKTAKGTVTVDANGTFTYTASKAARDAAASPSAGATDKTDAFTVTITDGHGTTTVVPVAVTVAPSAATVVFNFVYGSGSEYWNASARNAMQAAADILARYLVSANPTTLTYNLIGINAPGSGTLGSAHAYFSSYSTGYFGTVAQTKILTGVDTNGAAADGEITWNFAYPYNYGPAASTTDDSYDFTAVALHELLHTLGFISGIETPNADRNWTTYDNFLADSTGTKVINPDHRFNQAYVPNLTGGNGGIYWNGSNAVAAYGGLVPLYTPSTWSQDASLTHLDPANVGTESQVLNPFEFYGPGVRVLSPVEVGMLKDLGYPISSGSSFAAFALIGFGFLRRAKRNGNEGKDKKRTGNGANAKESAA